MSPPRYQSVFNYQHCSQHSSDGWQMIFTPVHGSVANVTLPPSPTPDNSPVYQDSNNFAFASMTSQGYWSSWVAPSNGSNLHDITDTNDVHMTNNYPKKGYKRRRSSDTEDKTRSYKKLKYFCSLCLKAFGYYTTFLSHLRTHSGERPFKCTSCPKAFTDRSTLIKHQRIHTGRRPYTCSLCGSSFTQSGNLHRHRRRMHCL